MQCALFMHNLCKMHNDKNFDWGFVTNDRLFIELYLLEKFNFKTSDRADLTD